MKLKCQFIYDIHSVHLSIVYVCVGVCVSPSVHQNYVGTDAEKNPFYLSVVLSDQNNQRVPQYRAILWRKTVSSPSAYLTALLGRSEDSHTGMCTILWSCRVVATVKVTDGVIGYTLSSFWRNQASRKWSTLYEEGKDQAWLHEGLFVVLMDPLW